MVPTSMAGMAATSEMWLVPEFPGMEELRAFNLRMMQELSVDATANQMSGLLAAQPGGAEALADLKKEASKMQGFPVLASHARRRLSATASLSPLLPLRPCKRPRQWHHPRET